MFKLSVTAVKTKHDHFQFDKKNLSFYQNQTLDHKFKKRV